ncbi:MAG: beta-ketoacyl-[acyl-carrier-protein] synthase family protein [Pirellulales bacterium]|nr:beta-ketoacyl-[acyl-carrier-protein] synthase family protein [Pirellulales bacterium]
MRNRVVVTGMGWINPLGISLPAVWEALVAGKSGVGPISIFDAAHYPTQIAAEVKDWTVADIGEDPEDWTRQARHTTFAIGAAAKAFEDSGLGEVDDPTRFGVYLGAGEGHQDFVLFNRMVTKALKDGEIDVQRFQEYGIATLNPVSELEQEPSLPSAHIAARHNAQGPNLNCLTACAASSQAIGEAVEMIRRGETNLMLSGGTHSMIHPFGVTGFNLLTALSVRNDEPERASRPFDAERDGFVLGEGAAMVMLEEYEHARRRNARIYGEIVGFGSTADAFRVTDSHPEGRGAASCMQMALHDAGVDASDVDYINAHGTSTAVNDKVETMAIRNVFGAHADSMPISSTKSMMGHLIAAAGATETIISLLALNHNVIPPTINYENPDPECDLDYVPNAARECQVRRVLTNSFGFGGQNIALLVAAI